MFKIFVKVFEVVFDRSIFHFPFWNTTKVYYWFRPISRSRNKNKEVKNSCRDITTKYTILRLYFLNDIDLCFLFCFFFWPWNFSIFNICSTKCFSFSVSLDGIELMKEKRVDFPVKLQIKLHNHNHNRWFIQNIPYHVTLLDCYTIHKFQMHKNKTQAQTQIQISTRITSYWYCIQFRLFLFHSINIQFGVSSSSLILFSVVVRGSCLLLHFHLVWLDSVRIGYVAIFYFMFLFFLFLSFSRKWRMEWRRNEKSHLFCPFSFAQFSMHI